MFDNVSAITTGESGQRALDPEVLRRMAAANMCKHEISEATGFKVDSVHKVAYKHGIKISCGDRHGVSLWPTRDPELLELFELGLTTAKIGQRMGLTKNTIIGRLHRIGKFRKEVPDPPPTSPSFVFPPINCCYWPHGNPKEPDFHFCGDPVAAPALPYCAAHTKDAYRSAKDAE